MSSPSSLSSNALFRIPYPDGVPVRVTDREKGSNPQRLRTRHDKYHGLTLLIGPGSARLLAEEGFDTTGKLTRYTAVLTSGWTDQTPDLPAVSSGRQYGFLLLEISPSIRVVSRLGSSLVSSRRPV